MRKVNTVTALNSPSLIFARERSETDSFSITFAHSPICLIKNSNRPSFEFALRSEGENKTRSNFSLYTLLQNLLEKIKSSGRKGFTVFVPNDMSINVKCILFYR